MNRPVSMRFNLIAWLLILSATTSCASLTTSPLGISRQQWMWRTLIADRVAAYPGQEIWRSGNNFYYFVDDKLEHIDQGQRVQERYQVEVIHKSL